MRLKNDVEENMILDSINNMSSNEKELERLRRNVNLRELENKELRKKLIIQDMEIHHLKKLKEILELTENYLPGRMKQISDKNDSRCEYAVLELKKLSDAIANAKAMLLSEEVEEDETRKAR